MSAKAKVLVAMSGGVDSSVAALMLREQGYEVIGITMKVWDYAASGSNARETGCCSIDSINDARSVAVKFGFPHYVLDLRKEFDEKIISNFVEEYMAGHTPNPCVLCNRYMKWEDLLKKADQLDCEFIATGHYSFVIYDKGRYFLRQGADAAKDQAYVLWGLTQEQLKRTLLPLGSYLKNEVKEMALQYGLPRIAGKSESFDICFIPDNDYRQFLKHRLPGIEEKLRNGDFVDHTGKVIGKHQGYPFYTIGQRKGLVVAAGHPQYVNAINPANNTVRLGTREELMSDFMKVKDINLMKYAEIKQLDNITTRIRYKDPGTASILTATNDVIHVKFHQPVSAITPGQSAVFFEGCDLVGGGIIL